MERSPAIGWCQGIVPDGSGWLRASGLSDGTATGYQLEISRK
jgi:hypothetical protein